MKRPKAIAFDVFETLFSLDALKPRLSAAGLPEHVLPTWFAHILRDAMALEITGRYEPFRDVAQATLQSLMAQHHLKPTRAAVNDILDGFTTLPPQPDAPPAIQMLYNAGIPLVTLSNGAAKSTKAILKNANLYDCFRQIISIDEVKHWKPAGEVYLHAADELDVKPKQLLLIAAHPWDIHGAASAGLATAYLSRTAPFPTTMKAPDLQAPTLDALATQILDL